MTEQRDTQDQMHNWVTQTLTEEIVDFFGRTDFNSEAGRVGPNMAIMAATRTGDVEALLMADSLFSDQIERTDLTDAQRGELTVFRDFARYGHSRISQQESPRVLPGVATIYNLVQDGGDDVALGDFAEVAKTNCHMHMRNNTTDSVEYGVSHGLMQVALEAYDNTYKLSRLRQPGMAPFWHQILAHVVETQGETWDREFKKTPTEIAASINLDYTVAQAVGYNLRQLGYLYAERMVVRKDPAGELEWAVTAQPVASELLELVRTNAIARLRSGLPEDHLA